MFNPNAALHRPKIGEHQNQVKVLIEKTASSLDDTALKMLFVSVQQNNIELCIRHAIFEYVILSDWWDLTISFFSLTDTVAVTTNTVCPRHCNPNNFVRLNSIQAGLIWGVLLWFGHSFVSECSIHFMGYSFALYGIVTSERHIIVSARSSLQIVIC